MSQRDASTSQERRLFEEFPAASADEWRRVAEESLRGAPFEKKLVTRTLEGLRLQPIYSAEDTAELGLQHAVPGAAPYLRGTRALGDVSHPWCVAQELPYPTPVDVNRAARHDLERGLAALHVPVDQATASGIDPDRAPPAWVGRGGMSLATTADAMAMLEGVALAKTPLLIPAGASALSAAALIFAAAQRRAVQPRDLQGCIGADPLGTLAARGALPASLVRLYDTMAWLTGWSADNAPRLRTIGIDTRPYHDGGATVVQDLAFALATGVEYLRAMQARGLSVDDVAPRMEFSFSVGASFFLEIARLRAARLLWARVIEVFAGAESSRRLRFHARTSAWTKTRVDAHNNLLRSTVEAFAAVVGGCDSLHVAPFDEALGLPDEFSRRTARNIQIVLQEESNLVRIVDPVGGSWYVESLTDEVARRAWETFQELERMGGMAQALEAGWPQARVAEVREERFSRVAHRRDGIVGVNRYANPGERPPEARGLDDAFLQGERTDELRRYRGGVSPRALGEALGALRQAAREAPQRVVQQAIVAAGAGATLGDLSAALFEDAGAQQPVAAIPAHRGAERFEELREAMSRHAERTGNPLPVFLAAMGPVSQHRARTDFATGFFQAGGFEVIYEGGFDSVEDAAAAARQAGASVVVICSTDETYGEVAPQLAALVKQDRPDVTVYVAGYPEDAVDALRAGGVDEFIHLRSNCHSILAQLQREKGIGS